MSLQSTFWHKGQRDTVGSMALGNSGFVAGTGHTITAVAIPITIASTGKVYTTGAITNQDISGIATANHANNPTKTVTDDSDSSTRTVLQIADGLVIPNGSQCYMILTNDGSGGAGAYRLYAGEVVLNTQTAKRPVLDLDDECPVGELYITNTSGSDHTMGTTAHAGMTYSSIAHIPAD